jgi:hypothetical protein
MRFEEQNMRMTPSKLQLKRVISYYYLDKVKQRDIRTKLTCAAIAPQLARWTHPGFGSGTDIRPAIVIGDCSIGDCFVS